MSQKDRKICIGTLRISCSQIGYAYWQAIAVRYLGHHRRDLFAWLPLHPLDGRFTELLVKFVPESRPLTRGLAHEGKAPVRSSAQVLPRKSPLPTENHEQAPQIR
jgi:hypothetical protein